MTSVRGGCAPNFWGVRPHPPQHWFVSHEASESPSPRALWQAQGPEGVGVGSGMPSPASRLVPKLATFPRRTPTDLACCSFARRVLLCAGLPVGERQRQPQPIDRNQKAGSGGPDCLATGAAARPFAALGSQPFCQSAYPARHAAGGGAALLPGALIKHIRSSN